MIEIPIYIHIIDRFGAHARPALKLQKIITDKKIIKQIAETLILKDEVPAKIVVHKGAWHAAERFVTLEILSMEEYVNLQNKKLKEKID